MLIEHVILVTKSDRRIGTMEKLKVHKLGELHRCVSIVVVNKKNQMLLQRRAKEKYHSAGLWSNAACSHQRPGERSSAAAHRTLVKEMGFDCRLDALGTFLYRAGFNNGLIEHEVDHVFIGRYDNFVKPNPAEVMGYAWRSISGIKRDLKHRPTKFAVWFPFVFRHAAHYLEK